MKKTIDKEKFIEMANEIHNNKYSYENISSFSQSIKAEIKCPVHGVFLQLPSNHLRRDGCPSCSKNRKKTTDDFIKAANIVHSNKYDYSKSIYINSTEKVIIICSEHGEFKQGTSSHLTGIGCPKCGRDKISKAISLSQEDFITKANLVHRNKYDYSKSEYINSGIKITITCFEHGDFRQTPGSHLSGIGCKTCGYLKVSEANGFSKEDFIKKSLEVHGDKYDYSKAEYKNNKSEIILICKTHKEFILSAYSHAHGVGCPLCKKESTKKLRTLTQEQFLERATLKHGDKYDYSETKYVGRMSPIDILCKKHGLFTQRANDHLSGNGCQSCKESKGEEKIKSFLLLNNIDFTQQEAFKDKDIPCKNPETNSYLYFDFYLSDFKTCIEFQGRQHYSPFSFSSDKSEETMDRNFKNLQVRDNIKKQYCKDNNIALFELHYNQFSNMEKILTKAFFPAIRRNSACSLQ